MMDDMEEKLNSILGNPQMMSQLMSMAQSLGGVQQENRDDTPPGDSTPLGAGLDLNMIQKVAGLAQKSNIDRNQQALLKALGPYLSTERIHKLEKAMRAAKIAALATTVLGNGALLNFGR